MVNFAFLALILVAVWRIRHIKDRLDVKIEMTYIVAIWSIFSLLQYVGYFVDQVSDCETDVDYRAKLAYIAALWTYGIIVLRDFSVLTVTIYFLVKVNRRENDLKNGLAKKDTILDL